MIYIDLVNSVMRRLRESEVSTVQGSGNSNSYARLIGDFVNESKSQVEEAWDWGVLRNTLSVVTAPSIFNYGLVGADNSFKLLNAINDTSNITMQNKNSEWFDNEFLNGVPATGAPVFYNFNGFTENGDIQVDIYPIPDGVYNLRFNGVVRYSPLSADTDKLYIPSRPVILLATAMAIEERGEDGGQQSMNAYAAAKSALSDAIALDAARHPEETTWYSV